MWLDKRNRICLAVQVVVGLVIPSALAYDSMIPTVLLPCGKAATDLSHQVVPDAGCQKISDTGAFAITSLGTPYEDVRLGFSATPDCQQTYIPSYKELTELKEEQKCQVYVAGAQPRKWEGTAKDASKYAKQAAPVEGTKKGANMGGGGETSSQVQKRTRAEDESGSHGGWIFRKRDYDQTGQNGVPAYSGEGGAAELALKYVVLVHASSGVAEEHA